MGVTAPPSPKGHGNGNRKSPGDYDRYPEVGPGACSASGAKDVQRTDEDARIPHDLKDIVPKIDQAYADALRKSGASFMLPGAVERRAQENTVEIFFAASRGSRIRDGI